MPHPKLLQTSHTLIPTAMQPHLNNNNRPPLAISSPHKALAQSHLLQKPRRVRLRLLTRTAIFLGGCRPDLARRHDVRDAHRAGPPAEVGEVLGEGGGDVEFVGAQEAEYGGVGGVAGEHAVDGAMEGRAVEVGGKVVGCGVGGAEEG